MKHNSQSTQCWRNNLFKKINLKKDTNNNSSPLGLTHQTHDLSHDSRINSYKINQKNNSSHSRLTWQARDRGHKIDIAL